MSSATPLQSSIHASPRHVLRSATAAEHARVEGITGPLTSRQAYVRYLMGSYSFRVPIERALGEGALGWPRCLDGWRPTLIAEQLQADLRDLALEGASPAPPFDLKNWNPIGVLYVLEGSSLGARLLERQVRHLGFDATFGARHLARQRESSWADFVTCLDRCSPEEFEGAAVSARATFDLVASSMSSASNALVG